MRVLTCALLVAGVAACSTDDRSSISGTYEAGAQIEGSRMAFGSYENGVARFSRDRIREDGAFVRLVLRPDGTTEGIYHPGGTRVGGQPVPDYDLAGTWSRDEENVRLEIASFALSSVLFGGVPGWGWEIDGRRLVGTYVIESEGDPVVIIDEAVLVRQ